VNTITFY